MSISANNTAVLIFANSSQEELTHKSFSKNQSLFEVLNQETLRKVKKSGLPFFQFTEKEQLGKSFGERFINAIQAVYNQGFENVITIGNDSPQLKTAHLLKAETQLQEGKTVLGPSFDGGFYLLGLSKTNFKSSDFLSLPWQRRSLFCGISQLLDSMQSVVYQLPTLQDIDVENDIFSLLNHVKTISRKVYSLLQEFVVIASAIPMRAKLSYSFLSHSLLFNKGSPSLS